MRETDNPGNFAYEQSYAIHLLVFTILITYSTLAPFIMVWGVLYFAMAYVSNKYNILYVNFPIYEGAGVHWVEVFNRIIAGTFLYQLVLVGVFGIYKFIPGAVISAILCVCSIVYGWYAHGQFHRSARYLPMRYAVGLDKSLDVVKAVETGEATTVDVGSTDDVAPVKTHITNVNSTDYYYQPSLVPLVDEPEIDVTMPKSPKLGKIKGKQEEEELEIRKGIDSGADTFSSLD